MLIETSPYRKENILRLDYKDQSVVDVMELIHFCCENHIKHRNALCEKREENFHIKAGGTYNDQS
jgi:hypothetical protein